MELREFLLARIDEDMRAALHGDCHCEDGQPQRPDCVDRIVAKSESERRIVSQPWPDGADDDADDWYYGIHADAHQRILRLLALPYADHPDYRDEWAPDPREAA